MFMLILRFMLIVHVDDGVDDDYDIIHCVLGQDFKTRHRLTD